MHACSEHRGKNGIDVLVSTMVLQPGLGWRGSSRRLSFQAVILSIMTPVYDALGSKSLSVDGDTYMSASNGWRNERAW